VKNQGNKAAPFTALDKQSKYSSYINGQFTDKLIRNSKQLNLFNYEITLH
jgi:hypothetical protein